MKKELLLFVICAIAGISDAQLQPMFLDPTFGTDGKVVSKISSRHSFAYDVAVQSDSKLIVAGSLTEHPMNISYFLLVRYNTDGSIDSSFGVQGSAIKNISVNNNYIKSVAIQPDGKIVAGGTIDRPYSGASHFTVVRFNNNGSVDSSFGKYGIVTIIFYEGPDSYESLEKLIVKPDGKTIVGGFSLNTFSPGVPVDAVIAQLNEDGSLDSSFGTNGKIFSSTGTSSRASFTMNLRSDSKIIAGGPHVNSSFAPMQFNANGTLDNTFGKNGFGDTIRSFTVTDEILQPDGKIVFSGHSFWNKIVLLRYNGNGTFDSLFGTYGKVISELSNQGDNATSVHMDLDGKILVSGYVNQNIESGSANFALLRYNTDGTLDSTFGDKGLITTDFSNGHDISHSSVVQEDGKIVLVGTSRDSERSNYALARYTSTVMPLNLLSITIKKDAKSNLLQWSTAQELNVERFEIEKSINGKEFTSIGKINAGTNRYNFTDENPLPGRNYYRLRIVNRDGKYEYSPVRMANNTAGFYLNVYPLPVKDRLNIQVESNKTQAAQIAITDLSGKTMIAKSISLLAGANNAFINVRPFGKGVYFLKVVTKEATETRKIVIN